MEYSTAIETFVLAKAMILLTLLIRPPFVVR